MASPPLLLTLGLGWVLLPATQPVPVPPENPAFEEVAHVLGVDFEHRHFGTGEKYMPENMGPGVAILDADGDGRLDLFFPQGTPLGPGAEGRHGPGDRLYRQQSDGTFRGSVVGEPGYGMGASFGDIDRDGDLDLFVTRFGRDALLENLGGGRFRSRVLGNDAWSSGAGFFDPDGDGDLDLFVARYLEFSVSDHKFCGNAQAQIRAYCHPDVYPGAADALWWGDGRGGFSPASLPEVRVTEAKGLGIAFFDVDGDGNEDVYVGNDSTSNHLYLGDGQGAFQEDALLRGLALSGAGRAEASMGIEVGDLTGDGKAELFLTHLDQETNTLYGPSAAGLWSDSTSRAGLGAPSLPWVGFGTVFLDFDHDGDLDIFVANGHIIDNIRLFDASRAYEQPAQLFENRGKGIFQERTEDLGLLEPLVGRGAAAGDLDRDGDLDLVITQNGRSARVLLNRRGQSVPSLTVRLHGSESNPQGFGARLELAGGEGSPELVRWMKSTSSYLSQGPPEVHFGLGAFPADAPLSLTVHWPSGRVETFDGLRPATLLDLHEGRGQVRTPDPREETP